MTKNRLCIMIAIASCASVCGCQNAYKGGNIHDGINASVGVKMPTASSASNTLQLLWLLNGWVFSWEENAFVKLSRTSVSHTKFGFGVYESSATNLTDVILVPCGTNGVNRLPDRIIESGFGCSCSPCACWKACSCSD